MILFNNIFLKITLIIVNLFITRALQINKNSLIITFHAISYVFGTITAHYFQKHEPVYWQFNQAVRLTKL